MCRRAMLWDELSSPVFWPIASARVPGYFSGPASGLVVAVLSSDDGRWLVDGPCLLPSPWEQPASPDTELSSSSVSPEAP